MAKKRISEVLKEEYHKRQEEAMKETIRKVGLLSDVAPIRIPESPINAGTDPEPEYDGSDFRVTAEDFLGITTPKVARMSWTEYATSQGYEDYTSGSKFMADPNDYHRTTIKSKTTSASMPKNTVIVDESNMKSLIKRLFELHILTVESHCFGFMIEGLPRSMRENPTYVEERIRKDYSKYMEGLKYSGIIFANTEMESMFFNFLSEVYNHSGKKCFDVYIEFRESYEELLKLVSQKGVDMDTNFIELKNCDFKTLREKCECAQVVYLPMFNYIFVANDHYELFGRDQMVYAIRSCLLQLSDVQKPIKEISSEFVVINDKKYPKHILESILESDFDTFVSNLELEMFLENSN